MRRRLTGTTVPIISRSRAAISGAISMETAVQPPNPNLSRTTAHSARIPERNTSGKRKLNTTYDVKTAQRPTAMTPTMGSRSQVHCSTTSGPA